MIGKVHNLLLTATVFLLSLSVLSAQPKAVGAEFSANGLGLSYEHRVESDNFISLHLWMEADDYIWLRADHPGASLSLSWNMVFAEKTSPYGNRITFFAGPGIIAGYVTDFKNTPGAAFGLKGRIGVECRFKRSVTLSASLSPIIGCHITSSGENIKMLLYKSGLLQTVIPEIGLKYAF